MINRELYTEDNIDWDYYDEDIAKDLQNSLDQPDVDVAWAIIDAIDTQRFRNKVHQGFRDKGRI